MAEFGQDVNKAMSYLEGKVTFLVHKIQILRSNKKFF